MQPTRCAGVVLGMLISSMAGAAALGSGGIDNNPPPVTLEPAKPAPAAASAVPVQSSPVVVAPPPIKPAGFYSLTYDVDRNAGVAGHVVIGNKSVWLWAVTGSWSSEDERYVGSAGHSTTESSATRAAVETGYRRLLATGPTRTFVDSTVELGYSERTIETDSNLETPAIDIKSSERDTHLALSIKMGFEYFFSPAVSVEGAAGVTLKYVDYGGQLSDYEQAFVVDRSGHETTLDLFDAGLRVNYYW